MRRPNAQQAIWTANNRVGAMLIQNFGWKRLGDPSESDFSCDGKNNARLLNTSKPCDFVAKIEVRHFAQHGLDGRQLGLREISVLRRARVEWSVLGSSPDFADALIEPSGFFRKKSLLEKRPNVVHRWLRRVEHVARVEAVIAQIVEQKFVGREVVRARQLVADFFAGQHERGFAALVFDQAAAQVPHGAYGHNYL
jgi:hypothetical protein